MTKRNVYGMDYRVERGTEGANVFGTLAGILGYGCYDDYENDTFKYIPYNEIEDGETDDYSNRPLFIHKKTGFKLCWYKYPLRSAYCNLKDITSDILKEIVEDCVKSLPEEEQTKYYDAMLYTMFKTRLNSRGYIISPEPHTIEEYYRDENGKLLYMCETDSLGRIKGKTTYNSDGKDEEYIDYINELYNRIEYEEIENGYISKKYHTNLRTDNDYKNATFILNRRDIVTDKDGKHVVATTNYVNLLDTTPSEKTTVMIEYNNSDDYTSIRGGRETYIHENGILKKLIEVNKEGHMSVIDVDAIRHINGINYYFINDNFVASKQDENGNSILNVDYMETTKSIYDDNGKLKRREYYLNDFTSLNKVHSEYVTNSLNKITKNSMYGKFGNGGLHKIGK